MSPTNWIYPGRINTRNAERSIVLYQFCLFVWKIAHRHLLSTLFSTFPIFILLGQIYSFYRPHLWLIVFYALTMDGIGTYPQFQYRENCHSPRWPVCVRASLQQSLPIMRRWYRSYILLLLLALTSLTFENEFFITWCVTMVHWSHSNVTIVFWNDSLASFKWKYSSITPFSKILRKYRGISVRPIAATLTKGEKISSNLMIKWF